MARKILLILLVMGLIFLFFTACTGNGETSAPQPDTEIEELDEPQVNNGNEGIDELQTNAEILQRIMEPSPERSTIALGRASSFVIQPDGSLWAWGRNHRGQLGDGTTTDRLEPVKVMDDVIAISAGYYHSLAITTDGGLWAWGCNARGSLGIGAGGGIHRYPARVMDDVIAISAGNHYSLAVTSDGGLWAWGYNGDGRLGDGTTQNRDYPVRVLELSE